MLKDILKKIILESQEKAQKYISRNLIPTKTLTSQNCVVLVGARRAGKSYYLMEIKENLKKLLNKKDKDFVYLNFEDERLVDLKTADLDLILESYQELYSNTKPILLLDEIQNVKHWEKFARRLADNDYRVYITGSNSKLLSKEIASTLGARYLQISVNPFNFKEYLEIVGFEFDSKTTYYSKDLYQLKKYMQEYLEYGGFPEIAKKEDRYSKLELLKTYFDLYIYKDLSKRWAIDNPDHLILIIKKIKENIGNESNPNSIFEKLSSINVPISVKTTYNYVTFLKNVFLISEITIYRKSFTKREAKKKYYFIDNGFLKLFEIDNDYGKKLENLVCTELVKQKKEIYYWRNKKDQECDFIIKDQDKITGLIQVTYEFNNDSKSREIIGLTQAMDFFKCKVGTIITLDQEDKIIIDNKTINIIPLYKWLLTGK
ncbi:MAG: ATP-binding protein [archaeon]|jgi:hypothetical protein